MLNDARFNRPAARVFFCGLLVAAAILLARGPSVRDEERRVVITGGDLLQLQAAFMRTWQREPTVEELRGSLEQHIRQEVLYREALARGYDRDDLVVRRAMQQKMEFLAASQALQEPPSEEEVEAFFALRQEKYRLPAVVSLVQVYISVDQRGEGANAFAGELLEQLRRDNPDPASLREWGDPIMLPTMVSDQTAPEVERTFGREFVAQVRTLAVGEWSGPIRSGYGLHLVKVLEREDSRIPEWREVAGRVMSDMEFEAKTSARDQLYQEIAQNYEIVLDGEVRGLLETAE